MESAPGKGSSFWFVIPAKPVETPAVSVCNAEAAEVRVAEKAKDAPRSGRRILVVEDNPVNQMVASRALLTLGYVADIASGGEEALAALGDDKFNLILMDCQMPGMDGYETAAEIRRRETEGFRIPIVAMTANRVEGDRERCLAAGMDDYLSKPIRLAALGKTLKYWLEEKVAAVA